MYGEVGREELGGVVRFEVACLVSDPRVARRMGFVEGVRSELLPVGPDLVQYFLVVSVGFTAVHEFAFQFLQDGHLLLTHRFPEFVALTTCEVGEQAAEQHDLFLIDGYAVRILEIFLHDGNVVRDGFYSLFAPDKFRNVVHWSRPVEGVHGDEVSDDSRFEFAQVFLHSSGLELEHRHRAPFLKQLVGLGVINGDMVDINIYTAGFLDITQALFDDGKGDESEEVHLDQSDRLDYVAVVFGYQHAFFAHFVLDRAERCKVRQVVRSDDNAAGVNAHLADSAFEPCGICQHIAGVGVSCLFLVLQFGNVFVAVEQVHFGLLLVFCQVFEQVIREVPVRNKRLEFIHFGQWNLLHASYIRKCGLGSHFSVCDDVRHMRLAVFAADVVQYLASSAILEVSVYIRQRYTVGVEETFEQQVVFQRVKVCYLEAVCHYRSGRRTTARADGHVQFLACGTDEIHDDKEIARETH